MSPGEGDKGLISTLFWPKRSIVSLTNFGFIIVSTVVHWEESLEIYVPLNITQVSLKMGETATWILIGNAKRHQLWPLNAASWLVDRGCVYTGIFCFVIDPSVHQRITVKEMNNNIYWPALSVSSVSCLVSNVDIISHCFFCDALTPTDFICQTACHFKLCGLVQWSSVGVPRHLAKMLCWSCHWRETVTKEMKQIKPKQS